MDFTPARLPGVFTIDLKCINDARGFFARSFCQHEFADHGLATEYPQCNMSWNEKAFTLRGMHYQLEPHAEVKLVRCIRGAIYDVIIDLRADSPAYCQWEGFELTADNRTMLYVPKGFAHGYLSLLPDTEVFYMVSEFYSPGYERAVRWNDPAFNIQWPTANPILSPKDAAHEDYKP